MPATRSEGSRSHQKHLQAVKAQCLMRCATSGLALDYSFMGGILPPAHTLALLVWVCCSIPTLRGHCQAPCSGQGWPLAMLNPLHRAQLPSGGCNNETPCKDIIHRVLPSYSSLFGQANLSKIGKGLKQLSKPVLERLGLCVDSRYQ